MEAKDVICSLPPQCLLDLIPSNQWPIGYTRRLKDLPEPSGALVFYGAVRRDALPEGCPGHLQWGSEHPGSLFISVSREGDGQVLEGEATVIASVNTPTADWCRLDEPSYQAKARGTEEHPQRAGAFAPAPEGRVAAYRASHTKRLRRLDGPSPRHGRRTGSASEPVRTVRAGGTLG